MRKLQIEINTASDFNVVNPRRENQLQLVKLNQLKQTGDPWEIEMGQLNQTSWILGGQVEPDQLEFDQLNKKKSCQIIIPNGSEKECLNMNDIVFMGRNVLCITLFA